MCYLKFCAMNFSGATFGKGINRMLATLAGGTLGLGADSLATLTGSSIGHPILIAIFVFTIGIHATYLYRLQPLISYFHCRRSMGGTKGGLYMPKSHIDPINLYIFL